jgi:polysaccharide biosynthesis protein PslG
MATECSRAGRGLLVATLGVAILLAGCGSGHSHSSASHSSSSSTATSTSTLVPAPAVLQPPAQPPPAGASFGINVNRLFNDGTYSLPEISAQLLALQRTGVKLARSDALWERSEPAAPAAGVHHYDWSFDDLIVTELALHGVQWLPIIDYSAYWDESIPGQDHSPPASFADYAAYAAAVAARYGTGGTFWSAHPSLTPQPVTTYEIWNEPDGAGFWLPGPQPDLYSDLYLTARAAILAAQPTARVIVGGLTSPTTFLPAMLAARPQLLGHIDGVGIHPYAKPDAMVAKIRADRATLVALGMPSVPLYVTEFGWGTMPSSSIDYAPANVRPSYIRRSFDDLGHLDCGLAAVILYTWVTPQADAATVEDWYGIHPPHGGIDPSTAAFAQGLRLASQTGGPQLPACPT